MTDSEVAASRATEDMTEEKTKPDVDDDNADTDEFSLSLMKRKKKKPKAKKAADDTAAADALDAESADAMGVLPSSIQNPERDYNYTELLERVFSLLHEKNPALSTRKRYSMPPPQLVRVGTRKTMWTNFAQICALMHRQPEHVMSFLLAELGTDGSIDGNQRLVIKGRYQPKQAESLLKKYIVEYVTCHMCVWSETPVNMASGVSMAIKTVDAQSTVLGYTGAGDAGVGVVPRTVTAHVNSGVKECVELLFNDGRTLVCTSDHRVLTTSGWVEAGDLVVGESEAVVGVQYPKVSFEPSTWSLELPELSSSLSTSRSMTDSRADLDEADSDADELSLSPAATKKRKMAFTLNVSDRASLLQSLAIMRILGYLLTDGSVSVTDGKVQAALYLGHKLDVAAVLDDVFLVTGKRPLPHQGKRTIEVALPTQLGKAMHRLCAVSGRRVATVTHLPAFLLAADCPVVLVREFLAGMFGGDGHTLSVAREKKGSVRFHGIAFSTCRKGDVAAAQVEAIKSELLVLLTRAGVNTEGAMVSLAHAQPCELEAVERGELSGADVQAGRRVEPGEPLESCGSYVLLLELSTASIPSFAAAVGFRYSCHKAVRLSAGMAWYGGMEYIRRQRVFIQEFVRDSSLTRLAAVQAAKDELAKREVLHPATVAWKPRTRPELESRGDNMHKLFVSAEQALVAFDIAKLFSSDPRPYAKRTKENVAPSSGQKHHTTAAAPPSPATAAATAD